MTQMQHDHEPRPARRGGCGLIFFLAGILAIAGGAYLMNRWDALGGAAKAGAVVLVVLGTLMVLPMLISLALGIVVHVWLARVGRQIAKAIEELSEAGGEMLQTNKAMYEQVHEFREPTEEDFASLDREFYDSAQRTLSELGFRHLGDLVDTTIEQLQGISPVIRVMASPDGTTAAGFYHFSAPQMPRRSENKPLAICDLASEFSDGTFLTTSNTQGLDMTTPPAQIARRQHPLDTPLPQLVAAHETERQKLLAAKSDGGVTCMTFTSLQDVIESERRQQTIKNAYRKQIGYIDPDEVRRIARTVQDDDEFADLSANIAEQARKKHQQQGDGSQQV